MRKLLLCVLAALALGLAAVPSPAEVLDGCVAVPRSTCEYVAQERGSIAAVGDWLVEVWWNGVCGSGEPNWIRGRFNGDNNLPGGQAGTWEGSIAPGSCARASAYGNSVVAIGTLIPPGKGEVPPLPEPPPVPPPPAPPPIPPDLPSIPPSLPPLP